MNSIIDIHTAHFYRSRIHEKNYTLCGRAFKTIRPILYINICAATYTILNFDGVANADIKCEQAHSECSLFLVWLLWL